MWPEFCRHFGGPSQEELEAELAEDAEYTGAGRDPFSAPVDSGYALPEWGGEVCGEFTLLRGRGPSYADDYGGYYEDYDGGGEYDGY